MTDDSFTYLVDLKYLLRLTKLLYFIIAVFMVPFTSCFLSQRFLPSNIYESGHQ